MIYLNQAATSFHKPDCVRKAVLEALSGMGSAARGASAAELSAARQIWAVRQSVAELFGFDAAERVVFTANATQALNTAIFGLLNPGDTVIATDWDHNSVLRPLYRLRQQGIRLEFWRADAEGRLSLSWLRQRLGDSTLPTPRLVICTHASNLTGAVLDISQVSAFAHRAGALCLVDAAQSAGSIPIDMREIKADLLCFTGHKGLMGPQGIGGLLVAPGVELRPLISGGTGICSYERAQPENYPEHLEAGTLNGPGICGLGAAVRYLQTVGVESVHRREQGILKSFRAQLGKIEGIRIYGAEEGEHSATIAFNLRDIPSAELADALSERYGITTRAGAHCAPRMHAALGTKEQGAVRISFGCFNTEAELMQAAEAVRELAEERGGET